MKRAAWLLLLLLAPVAHAQWTPVEDPREFLGAWPGITPGDDLTLAWAPLTNDRYVINWRHLDDFDTVHRWEGHPESHLMRPLVAQGTQTHLVWTERPMNMAPYEGDRILWTCILVANDCTKITALSEPGRIAAGAQIAVAGDRAAIVYEDGDPENREHERLIVRIYEGGTWGPPITLDSRSSRQIYADIVFHDGDVHLAWWEKDPDFPDCNDRLTQGCPTRVAHTYIRNGQVREITEISEYVEAEQVAPVLASGGSKLHVIYSELEPLYLHPPFPRLYYKSWDGAWDEGIDIARSGPYPVAGVAMRAQGDTIEATWVQSFGSRQPEQRVSYARFEEDIWQRANQIQSYFGIRDEVTAAFEGDAIHMAAVFRTENGYEGIHYDTWSAVERVYEAPEVSFTKPSDHEWVKDQIIQYFAGLNLSAPLESATITVAGTDYAGHKHGAGVVANSINVGEGRHPVTIHVKDSQGGEVTTQAMLNVDRTAAPVTSSILDENDQPVGDGWHASSLRIVATIGDGGGSPQRLQVQTDDGAWLNWGNLDERSSWPVPGNKMFSLRVRSSDDAGNVALAAPHRVGWDDQAPLNDVEIPDWVATIPPSVHVLPAPSAKGSPTTIAVLVSGAMAGEVAATQYSEKAGARVALPVNKDGSYTASIQLTDAVGNQRILNHTFAIDTVDPDIRVAGDGDHWVVRATDEGSGLSRLEAMRLGESTNATAAGASELQVRVAKSALPIRVTATDQAGNRGAIEIAPDGGIKQRPSWATDGGEDQDDDGDGPGNDAPEAGGATPLPILAALAGVAVAALVRRRNR